MFERIETKKRSQLAAEMLLKVIKERRFKTGGKLPPEREIAQEMGVSRNTLREAIAALQIIGILEARRSQGIFVLSLGYGGNMSKTMSEIFNNNEDPFAVMEARIAFEPGAAVIAANLATDRDLEDLKNRVTQIRNALLNNSEMEYLSLDREFHQTIACLSNNLLIISTINSLLQAMAQPLWRAMKNDLGDKETSRARIQEHEAIFKAIAERNEESICSSFRIHLKNSKNRFHLEPRAEEPL